MLSQTVLEAHLVRKASIPAPAELAVHALDFNAVLLLKRHKLLFLDAEKLHPLAKLKVLNAKRIRRVSHVDSRKCKFSHLVLTHYTNIHIAPYTNTKTRQAQERAGAQRTLITHRICHRSLGTRQMQTANEHGS